MHSEQQGLMNNLQKKIVVVLLILVVLTPAGLLLPMFFNTGDAWGEWSAETLKEVTGYVPAGLAKYTKTWKAPLKNYTFSHDDSSRMHQSGYYLVSGILGAMLAMSITLLLSKLIIRNGK